MERQGGAVGGAGRNGGVQQVPPQNVPPPTASDWTGRFEGVYSRGRGDTPMQLTLATNEMGKLTGELKFGGGNNVPAERTSSRRSHGKCVQSDSGEMDPVC